jgi:ribose 5-phosphate isomerase B
MKVAVGSDHAGFALKEVIKEYLKTFPVEVEDFGAFSPEPVDYPDVAQKVAEAVSRQSVDRGILICGTGIGMCMSANKFPGVRAALCHEPVSAYFSRAHNDANVLTMGGRIVGSELAKGIVKIWLEQAFEGGRHARRVEKMKAFDHAC